MLACWNLDKNVVCLSELYGDTLIEQAKCDSIVDFCEDLVFVSYFTHGAPDELTSPPTTEKVSYTLTNILFLKVWIAFFSGTHNTWYVSDTFPTVSGGYNPFRHV